MIYVFLRSQLKTIEDATQENLSEHSKILSQFHLRNPEQTNAEVAAIQLTRSISLLISNMIYKETNALFNSMNEICFSLTGILQLLLHNANLSSRFSYRIRFFIPQVANFFDLIAKRFCFIIQFHI